MSIIYIELKIICFLFKNIKVFLRTRITVRTVGTNDAFIHKLNTTTVLRTGAWRAVVGRACDGIAVEALRAKLAVATGRVVLADTET